MSVLGTISLSGLNTTNSDLVYCGELYATTNITLQNGGTLTLPVNSINDTALSSNVALRNQANTFTNTNQFTTTALAVTMPTADNSTNIATTQFVKNQNYIPATGVAFLANTQTFTGTNTFSQQVTMNNGFVSNGQFYAQRGAGLTAWQLTDTTNATTTTFTLNNNLFVFYSGGNNGIIRFQVKDTGGTIRNILDLNYASTLLYSSTLLSQPNATLPLATDSSSLTPTTQWVQSAISAGIAGATGFFVLANSNTCLGQNIFTQVGSNIPLTIQSSSSPLPCKIQALVASGAGSYNPCVQANDCVIFANGSTMTNGVLTLTSHSNDNVGIKINNTSVVQFGGPTYMDINWNGMIYGTTMSQLGSQFSFGNLQFNAWPINTSSCLLYGFTFNPGTTYPLGTYAIQAKISITGASFLMCITSQTTTNFLDSFTFPTTLGGLYVCNLTTIVRIGTGGQQLNVCVQANATPFVLQNNSTITITRLA